MMTQAESYSAKVQIEQFIDSDSISGVLEMIAEICWEKSEHIASNWQDLELARLWERAGNQVSGLRAKEWVNKVS